jgi:hypothetical protein
MWGFRPTPLPANIEKTSAFRRPERWRPGDGVHFRGSLSIAALHGVQRDSVNPENGCNGACHPGTNVSLEHIFPAFVHLTLAMDPFGREKLTRALFDLEDLFLAGPITTSWPSLSPRRDVRGLDPFLA